MGFFQSFKNFINRFRPVSVKILNYRLDEQKKENQYLEQKMDSQFELLQQQLQNSNLLLAEQLQKILDQSLEIQKCLNNQYEQSKELIKNDFLNIGQDFQSIQKILESSQRNQKVLAETMEKIRIRNIEAARNSSEAVWAWTFNNTISGTTWLKDRAFSPGRWAMGYPNLYAMYRILNEARPKRILELGLGQSTRMIGQYAEAFEDVKHLVIEHDQSWIDFFSHNFHLTEKTEIIHLDREMIPYKEAKAVRAFHGFHDILTGKQFDFISIDAPLGGDMKQYSRIDILSILPECLSKDFVILIDDYERIGEQNTVKEIEECLRENNILYKKGKYSGKKDCMVITAEHLMFLTSM